MLSAWSSMRPPAVIPTIIIFFLLENVCRFSPAGSQDELRFHYNYIFLSFDWPVTNRLTVRGSATFDNGALELTPKRSNSSYKFNSWGQAFLIPNINLWFGRSFASFNTSFTFNIDQQAYPTPGEGFTFLISTYSQTDGQGGEYIGLPKSRGFIAVEFDTFKQQFDPDDNHIGLNINSHFSNVTASLTPFKITLAPKTPTKYRAWIDYDGQKKHIWAYIAREGDGKPQTSVLDSPLNFGVDIFNSSDAYFGFSASTGSNTYQINSILAWNLTVYHLRDNQYPPPSRAPPTSSNTFKLLVGLLSTAIILSVLVPAAVCYYIRKHKRRVESISEWLKQLPGMPEEFTYKQLKRATNNFNEKNKLGQGGFGVVYKGVVSTRAGPDRSKQTIEVAVKMFSKERSGTFEAAFVAELSIINRLRHRHLVPLVGWCHRKGVLLLVYEYMPNGSLDKHLFGGDGEFDHAPSTLSWNCRNNIIAGVASALQYLHYDYNQTVLHRDLKASNVMLDADFQARLGDFGLARAIDNGRSSYTDLAGTVPYIAFECFRTGKATRKSDVFSFGIFVLEVVCGRRQWCDIPGFHVLVDWVWHLYSEGQILEAVDGRLFGEFDDDQAERLLLLGLACSNPNSFDRPKMTEVVQMIADVVPPPAVPLTMPAFVWQAFDDDIVPAVFSVATVSPVPTSSLRR